MPLATPELLRLRLETGIKPGEWAARVKAARSHYSNVERQRVVGSPELFNRCASELTQELGRTVRADDLMDAGKSRDVPNSRHTSTGRTSTEPTETGEATEATAEAEASVRRSA